MVENTTCRSLPQEVLYCGRVGACTSRASRRFTTKNHI